MGMKGTSQRGASQEKPRRREKPGVCSPGTEAGKHRGSVLPARDELGFKGCDMGQRWLAEMKVTVCNLGQSQGSPWVQPAVASDHRWRLVSPDGRRSRLLESHL